MAKKEKPQAQSKLARPAPKTKPDLPPSTKNSKVFVLVLAVAVIVCGFLYQQSKFSDTLSRNFAGILTSTNKTGFSSFTISCYNDPTIPPPKLVEGCSVSANCARIVMDDFVTQEQATKLQNMARKLVTNCGGGGEGGPTIIDMANGAITYKNPQFVNFLKILETLREKNGENYKYVWSEEEYRLFLSVVSRIKQTVQEKFGLKQLYLTKPLFFSHIEANKEPKSMNDEYWHKHIDRIAYGSFDYTSLLYLSDYGVDFEGGRFVFHNSHGLDEFPSNDTLILEPVKGRLNVFTSGAENVHHVERVTKGVRYALTVAFTCDAAEAIQDDVNSSLKGILVKA